MRALILSHRPVIPLFGGDRVRINQLISLVAQRYDTDVMYLANTLEECGLLSKEVPRRVHAEKWFHYPRWQRIFNLSTTLLNNKVHIANHFNYREIRRWLASVADDYDLLIAASPAMSPYLFPYQGKKRLVDLTDSLTMNYRNAANTTAGPKKWFYTLMAKRMERLERRCRKEFDACAYISEVDIQFIQDGSKNVHLLSNAVKVPGEADCTRYDAESQELLFVGKMDYLPNVQAVTRFVERSWPDIVKACPQASFTIAGASPAESVKALADNRITVTGFVESLSPLFQRAALVVAPMVSGSGIQNKILEAMAHGCCVVTTPTGAEGLTDVGEALVVKPFEEIASACVDLLGDWQRRRQIGAQARQYVSDHFSKDVVSRQFDSILAAINKKAPLK
ncbi:MAG: glycosyltransferase [Bacteroidales bacterium]|nr:glycosyltransferase [Bacteroidales bacterium]